MRGSRLATLIEEAQVSGQTMAEHLGESLEELGATLSSRSVDAARVRQLRWAIEELREPYGEAFAFRTYRLDFITSRGRRGGYDTFGETLSEALNMAPRVVRNLAGGMVRISNPDGHSFYRVEQLPAEPEPEDSALAMWASWFPRFSLERASQADWLAFPDSLPKVGLGEVRGALARHEDITEVALLVEQISFHDPELALAANHMFADYILRAEGELKRTPLWRGAMHADRAVGAGEHDAARRAAARHVRQDLRKVLFLARDSIPVAPGDKPIRVFATWRGLRRSDREDVLVPSMFSTPGLHPSWARGAIEAIRSGGALHRRGQARVLEG
jgi:hypothetical protein